MGRSKSDLLRPAAVTENAQRSAHGPSPRVSACTQSLMLPMRPRLSSTAMTADIEADHHLQHWLEITESASTATTALSALSGLSVRSDGTEFDEGRKQLRQWLVVDVGLAMYYNTFVLNGYESLRFIQDIEGEHELEELGIVLKGHKRRIMAEIERLRRRNAPDYDVQVEQMEEDWQQMEEAEEKAAEEKATAMGFVKTISTMELDAFSPMEETHVGHTDE